MHTFRPHLQVVVCWSILGSATAAKADIMLFSQTHHVEGQATGTTADGQPFAETYSLTDTSPISGTAAAGYYVPGFGWVLNAVSSTAGNFGVSATDRSGWIFTGSSAEAESSYRFQFDASPLELAFTGFTTMHAFENWVDFALADVTESVQIDTHRWATEQLPGDPGSIEWLGSYDINPQHLYQLDLHAHVRCGDQPSGDATLNVTVSPEPSSAVLALAGALLLTRRVRRGRIA